MSLHENKIFFRYRAISINSLFEISSSAFYASPASAFNDPFYCSFDWIEPSKEDFDNHLGSIDRELNQSSSDEVQNACELLKIKFNKTVSNLGVTCFTTDPFNPLMWAHYSEGHRGICLEYKREGILLDSEKFKTVNYDRPPKIYWSPLSFLSSGFDNKIVGQPRYKFNSFIQSSLFGPTTHSPSTRIPKRNLQRPATLSN